ncbi:LamG-like jellyroll fold domain-containing protein [Vibrio splendidus]
MQISKVATAVALSTGLLFGCNSDGLPIPTDGSTDPATPTSALLNGYWEFSDTAAFSTAYSSSSSDDLPNVYRFSADGETLYYYTDNSADTTLGEYERFETTYEETIEDETSGQVAFTLFNDDGTVSSVSVDGDYSAADGGLAIGGNIPVSGTDHSDNTEVTGPADTADEASGVDNAAQILDTLTDDTGELRLKILNTSSTVGKTISSGKLTVDLTYQLNPDSEQVDEGQNNSYISLYSTNDENDKVSNAYHHGDIAIGDGIIQYRDASGSLTATGGTFDANSTFDATVEVVWTPTSHTFTINGETYTGAVSSDPGSFKEVQVIALRLGTNSGVTPYELIADNLKVYSLDESSGEYVEEFKDNFNDYSVGYDLNNSPYNSSTSEATVISLSGDDGSGDGDGDGDGDGNIAQADFEWNFSDVDGGTALGKTLTTSKNDSNPKQVVDGAASTGGAVHITQSTDSGSYGYYYTTMDSSSDPLAFEDGTYSMEIVFSADDVNFNPGFSQDLQLLENTDSNKGYKLIIDKSSLKPKFRIYDGSGSTSVEAETVLTNDTFMHILATFNNGEAKLYINGVLEKEATGLTFVPNTKDGDKVYIGGGSNSSQKNLEGVIDNAAFFNDVLTADEVAARANYFGLSAE